MFTDDPYSSRQEDGLEMTPVSQTSSMLMMANDNENKDGVADHLNESYPLMNALVVK